MGRGVQLLLRRVCPYRNDACMGTVSGLGCLGPPVLTGWRKITSMQITLCWFLRVTVARRASGQVCHGLHRHRLS